MRCISVWFSLSGIDVAPWTTSCSNISLSSSKVLPVLVLSEAGTGVVSGSSSGIPPHKCGGKFEVGSEEDIEFSLTLNDVCDSEP